MEANNDPILIDLPDRLETERLVLRSPRSGDGALIYEAAMESIEALQRWMAWSRPTPTLEQMETWCRKSQAEFQMRKALPLLLFRKDTGEFVGSSGMHNMDWSVPRFEIGYWVRRTAERQGYVTEAVSAMTLFLFGVLSAKRVEIRMDDGNERSWRVPERLGFQLEGVLRNDSRDAEGRTRSTRVYSKISDE